MATKKPDPGLKYCNVCGEPAAEIICERCKAKIQGEAAHQKQQVEKKGKTNTSRS